MAGNLPASLLCLIVVLGCLLATAEKSSSPPKQTSPPPASSSSKPPASSSSKPEASSSSSKEPASSSSKEPVSSSKEPASSSKEPASSSKEPASSSSKPPASSSPKPPASSSTKAPASPSPASSSSKERSKSKSSQSQTSKSPKSTTKPTPKSDPVSPASESSTTTSPSPSRILLMPFPYKSHVSEFKHIGEALVQKGHEVHMVLQNHFPGVEKFKEKTSPIAHIGYEAVHPDYLTWPQENLDLMMEQELEISPIDDFRINIKGFVEICYNVLEIVELEEQVKRMKFDLVIIDGFPMTRCFYVFAYRLGLPYISVTTTYEPWLMRNPALPSFVPFPLHEPPLTQEMSFLQRVSNMWILLDWTYRAEHLPYLSDDLVTKYAPEQPVVSLNHLASKSLLWLFDTDISIDYARPMMPNEINIGGLSVNKAKPLPRDLEEFVSSAKSGTIIASFGSTSVFSETYMLKLLEGFQMLPSDYHVLFRWDKTNKPSVSKNIRLMDWVPQNDVLGHNNTKLFITHGGANGQFEALYNAVPMINFPLYADQPYNSLRADYHGVSETLDIKTVTPELLHDTMMKILTTSTYRDNMAHASSVFRSQPLSPRERAAWWVEHVLQYGGQHLHAHALDMPAYQYLMLDILAFLILVVCCGLLLLYSTCCLVFKWCASRKVLQAIAKTNNNEGVTKKKQ